MKKPGFQLIAYLGFMGLLLLSHPQKTQGQTLTDFCADFENTNTVPLGFSTTATARIKPGSLPLVCDAQGAGALKIDGVNDQDTSYTAMIGPIDVGNNTSPQLFFDLARQEGFYCYAFAGVKISVSVDGGNLYELVYHKNDASNLPCEGKNFQPTTLSLATTPQQADPSVVFSPNNCQQWRKEIVDLESFAGKVIVIKFEFYFNKAGEAANTLFLDNICINNCTQGAPANISKDPAERTSLCRTGTLKLSAQVNDLKGAHLLWEAASSTDGVYNAIGAASDTSFSAVMNTIGNYYFRMVSIKGGCTDTSRVAEVIINRAMRFEKHPLSVSFCNKKPLVLSAEVASSYAQLSYQWQRSGTLTGIYSDIPNATQSTYTPTAPGVNYYRVRARSVDSGCNEVFSFEASTTVDDSVDILQNPNSFSVCIGGKDTLRVQTAGSNPKYSWQEAGSANGLFQEVGTQSTYAPTLNTLGARYFRVLLESERGFCKDTSKVIKVESVEQPFTPTTLEMKHLCENSIFSFQVATQGGVAPLEYQWQKSSAAMGPWADMVGVKDSMIYAYSEAGTTYYRMLIRSVGRGCNTASTNAVAVNADTKVEILKVSNDTVICEGLNAPLFVFASNASVYQWQVSDSRAAPFQDLNEKQAEIEVPVTEFSRLYYRALVRNGTCADTSQIIVVSAMPNFKFSTQPKDVSACVLDSIPQLNCLIINGGPNVSRQWQSSDNLNGPWTPIDNSSSYLFTVPKTPGVRYYRNSAKSAICPEVFGNPARVEIIAPLSITADPQGFTTCLGSQQSINVSTSNPSITQYQWQSSADGQSRWKDLSDAQASQFMPASDRNHSKTWYRAVVKDGTLGCGTDTSLAVLVEIRTDFAIQKTLDICNNNFYGNNAQIQFADLIQVGDRNSSWVALDTIQNSGALRSLDFSNWTIDKNYRFVATSTDAMGSCINVSDTLTITVKACCPELCSTAPTEAFCNDGSTPIQLGNYLCINTERSGNWFITAGPGISIPEALNNAILNPQQRPPGIYTLSYQLPQNIQGCPSSTEEQFNIVQSVKAGTPLPDFSACNNSSSVLDLFTLLNGETIGGKWSVLSGNPGTAFQSNGRLGIKGLAPGAYRFQYQVSGAQGCLSDSAQIGINLQEGPSVDLGTDLQLTCVAPFVILSSPDSNNTQLRFAWSELSGQNIDNPSAARIRVNSAGTYVLSTQLVGSSCVGTDTILVSTAATLITAIQAEINQPRCAGEQNAAILVKNVSGGKAPFSYTLNGQNGNSGGQYRNLKAGSYTLLVKDVNNCTREETYILTEGTPLELRLSGPQEYKRCADPIEINLSSTAPQLELIHWQIPQDMVVDASDSLSRLIRPKASMVVRVSAQDQNGCMAETQLEIKVDKKIGVYLPNVFSPNGAQANQVFKPMAPAEKIQRINRFRVMDRWGNQVFEQVNLDIADANLGWNGLGKNGRYNQGVYAYVLEITYCDGEKAKLLGEVMLLQ